MEDSELLRFEATKAKLSWIGVIIAALGGPASNLSSDYVREYPTVTATNRRGEVRIIEVVDTEDEAKRRCENIARDFKLLGVDQWCETYDVPISFVRGANADR